MQSYTDHVEKLEFIKTSYPEEFGLFSKNLNKVVDNFWRRALSKNFMEYFESDQQTQVLSKDDVKEMFIKNFIDKTFERTYKIKNAPVKVATTAQNRDKI